VRGEGVADHAETLQRLPCSGPGAHTASLRRVRGEGRPQTGKTCVQTVRRRAGCVQTGRAGPAGQCEQAERGSGAVRPRKMGSSEPRERQAQWAAGRGGSASLKAQPRSSGVSFTLLIVDVRHVVFDLGYIHISEYLPSWL
jgi:hypothetical protein